MNPDDTGEDGDGQFIEWLNESEGFDLSDNLNVRWVCYASGDGDYLFLDTIYINATFVGNGTSWRIWDNPTQNPDNTYPWSWNFDFPNSTGYYEFYSIGKKTGSQDEPTPVTADAITNTIGITTAAILIILFLLFILPPLIITNRRNII